MRGTGCGGGFVVVGARVRGAGRGGGGAAAAEGQGGRVGGRAAGRARRPADGEAGARLGLHSRLVGPPGRTSRRHGRQAVAQAGILVAERVGTLEALRAGAVSAEQASFVLDALERLPLAERVRRRGEQLLLEEAGRPTPATCTGRSPPGVLGDPDRVEREAEKALGREDRAAHPGRVLTVTEDGCGGIRITARGQRRGPRRAPRRVVAADQAGPGGRSGGLRAAARPTRPRRRMWTRSSSSLATPSTPTSHRPATAPGPGPRPPSTPRSWPARPLGSGSRGRARPARLHHPAARV